MTSYDNWKLGIPGIGLFSNTPMMPSDNYILGGNYAMTGNIPLFNFPPMMNMDCFNYANFMPSINWSTFNFGNYKSYGSGNLGGTSNISGSASKHYGTPMTVSGVDYNVFGKAANEIKKLRPAFQQKLQKLWEYAKSKGWSISLTSGYRSIEQQRILYNQKLAGKKKCAVAAPGKSRHNFGCAVDIRINGKSSGNELLELGRYAKTIGVEQGLSFHEQWHFQVPLST